MSAADGIVPLNLTPASTRRGGSSTTRLALLGLVLPVGLALVWEAVVALGWVQGRLMPPPSVIFSTLANLSSNGDLWFHAQATLARVAWGFALGVAGVTLPFVEIAIMASTAVIGAAIIFRRKRPRPAPSLFDTTLTDI